MTQPKKPKTTRYNQHTTVYTRYIDIPTNLESSQFLEGDKWIERKQEVAEIACKRGTNFVNDLIEDNKKKKSQKKDEEIYESSEDSYM
jgi:hypothetical protein